MGSTRTGTTRKRVVKEKSRPLGIERNCNVEVNSALWSKIRLNSTVGPFPSLTEEWADLHGTRLRMLVARPINCVWESSMHIAQLLKVQRSGSAETTLWNQACRSARHAKGRSIASKFTLDAHSVQPMHLPLPCRRHRSRVQR